MCDLGSQVCECDMKFTAKVYTEGMGNCCFITAANLPIWSRKEWWGKPLEWMQEGAKASCNECKKPMVFMDKSWRLADACID